MRQILLYIFILLVCSVNAEQFKITGKVVDAEYKDPFIGVLVEIKDADSRTSTDIDGNFSIEVENGAILKFSYLGYYTKEVEILNDSSLVIELEESSLEDLSPKDIEKLSIITTPHTNERRPYFLNGAVFRPVERDSLKTNPNN